MKASKVLRRYTAGERDFRRLSFRGQSFKGQDLSGADFSEADIRSADFTGANLGGANFSNAKAGLQKRWALFLLILSWLLSGISGFIFLFNGANIAHIFNSPQIFESRVAGWAAVIVTIIIYIIIIRQGIEVSLFLALALAGAFTFTFTLAGVLAFAAAAAVAGAIAGAIAGSIAFAIALTIAGIIAESIAAIVAAIIAFVFAETIAVTVAGAVAFSFTEISDFAAAGVIAFAAAIVGFIVTAYIAWQAMNGDEKYALLQNTAIAFAAIGGTSFCSADLSDSDFTGALLKSTDLREAKLIRTCFHNTKLLDRVRTGTSYLQHSQVRLLILTGQGQDKNFDRLNLRGVNLKATFLTDASFIGTDLSEACLQDADLSRAKLVQTQLDGTDFTGATLTGAFIKDWNITHETNFPGVRCEYVYMRLPTKENPDPLRKPDNREEFFADGEFGDFIKLIVDTLDLYHHQNVDPRAIAISFKQLAENNPSAELQIVAMEVKGEDNFLLRAKTSPEADKSELSAEYFEIYNYVKALVQQEVQALMAEKDSRIRSLETMVITALKSPSFYAENYQNQGEMNMSGDDNSGGFSVGGSVGGNINNVQGDNNQVVQGDRNQVNIDTEASLTRDDISKLLEELEALVLTAELPEETKEEVTSEINAAKKATDKEEPKKNIALANLESVAQTLEKTNKTVDAGQKLWSKAKPIIVKIASWLGAAAGSYLLKL